jgi:hypothetical protein
VPSAATIVVAITMAVAVSRPLVAQSPAPQAEPLADAQPVRLRGAAAAAVERLNTASLFQGPVVQTSADAPWARVSALASGASVEVRMADGRRVRGRVANVSDDTLAVQASSGPSSIPRAEIRKVRVPDPGRLLLYGALGIGGGLAAGWAACPHCPTSNERRRRQNTC